MLYTMGFSNVGLDDIFEVLLLRNIKVLVDVRSKPYSGYLPHFNRESVRAYSRDVGIRYLWAGEFLGGLNPRSVEEPIFIEKMQRVVELQTDLDVVLLCTEKDPKKCHRAYKLCAWIHRNTDISPLHLLGADVTDARKFEDSMKSNWLHVDYGGNSS